MKLIVIIQNKKIKILKGVLSLKSEEIYKTLQENEKKYIEIKIRKKIHLKEKYV